jgi:hypothetical protein
MPPSLSSQRNDYLQVLKVNMKYLATFIFYWMFTWRVHQRLLVLHSKIWLWYLSILNYECWCDIYGSLAVESRGLKQVTLKWGQIWTCRARAKKLPLVVSVQDTHTWTHFGGGSTFLSQVEIHNAAWAFSGKYLFFHAQNWQNHTEAFLCLKSLKNRLKTKTDLGISWERISWIWQFVQVRTLNWLQVTAPYQQILRCWRRSF